MTAEQRKWLATMPLSRDHPNRIRVALALWGWSLNELSRRTGISRWKVERFAGGVTERIHPTEASRIASALELTIDEVFADRPDQDERFPELPAESLAGLGKGRGLLP